jgi:hypothetical protein
MIVGVQTSIDTGEPMPSPSQEIIQLLSVFAKAFTVPTFANAMVLLYGTILAPGRRVGLTVYDGPCPGTEDECQAPETTSNAD